MGTTTVKKSKGRTLKGHIDDFDKLQKALYTPKKLKADLPEADFSKGKNLPPRKIPSSPKAKVTIGGNPAHVIMTNAKKYMGPKKSKQKDDF